MDNFDTHKWFKKQYLEEANINEGDMTSEEAFRILRDIEAILPKRLSPSHIQLMGKALDHLQAGEITKMMDHEVTFSDVREGKEHSSNVEAHDLLGMIEDELDELQPSNDLIVRLSLSSPPEGEDYGYNGYDVEFETLGSGITNPDEDVNWMREGKMKKNKPKYKQ